MKKKLIVIIFIIINSILSIAQPIKVELKNTNNNWTLIREGKPYYIKGAGGEGHFNTLANAGGNSIRIWSAENADIVLDSAYKNGLTVMFGLWVQPERHGFDYNNEKAVKAQFDYFKKIVEKYKDHPAVLMWSIGNEVDLSYTNFKVWDAIQDIAKMIHEIDPNHPTTTVTAGLHEREVKLVLEKAPDIDIFSINTYKAICDIKNNIKLFGWTGPYIISEWGPDGHWEVQKTKWNAPFEQTSHEKAESYYDRYVNCILSNNQQCIGSYVFLWGQKQETTSTWYGIFTKDGKTTEIVDYVSKAWKGKWPANKAPSLDSIIIDNKHNGDDIYLKKNMKFSARVFASDDKNKKLLYLWEIFSESTDIKSGGDAESEPIAINGLIKKNKTKKINFKAPNKSGAYRLFVTVTDNQGKVAYANIPFYVNN